MSFAFLAVQLFLTAKDAKQKYNLFPFIRYRDAEQTKIFTSNRGGAYADSHHPFLFGRRWSVAVKSAYNTALSIHTGNSGAGTVWTGSVGDRVVTLRTNLLFRNLSSRHFSGHRFTNRYGFPHVQVR